MDTGSVDLILDGLHEAVFFPDRWPKVLSDLAGLVECHKAGLMAASGTEFRGMIPNEQMKEPARIFAEQGWAERNLQASRMISLGEPRFITDHDVFSDQEMESDPYYTEFLGPVGLRWGTATFIRSPGDDTMVVTFHRSAEFGPVSRSDADKLTLLRPHIARAALASTRLRLKQVEIAIQILENLGLPAAALDARGRAKILNRRFEALVPGIVEDRREGLRLKPKQADTVLHRTVTDPRSRGATFAVKASNPHVANVLPVSGAANDIFAGCKWVLVMIPVSAAGRIDSAVLQGLFDFTPAEAKAAQHLVLGNSVEEIAAKCGTSVSTVRTQLKSVFAKAGVTRQAELVSILANTRTPK